MCDLSAGVWEKGIEQGMARGTDKVFSVLSSLYAQGRSADIERAAKDRDYLNKLLSDYQA